MPNSLIINNKHYKWNLFWKLTFKFCGGSLYQAQRYLFMSRKKDNAIKYAIWLAVNKPGQTTSEVDYNKSAMEKWIEKTFYDMPEAPEPVKGKQKVQSISSILESL